jgi:purine-nucleoside phosphorylase
MEAARQIGLTLREGVYMMFSGPSFETPAEIVMARTLGADAVGMSTVPEAIAARHCGIDIVGVSLVTNMAAGILDQKLTHEEVQQTAAVASERFTRLVDKIIESVF